MTDDAWITEAMAAAFSRLKDQAIDYHVACRLCELAGASPPTVEQWLANHPPRLAATRRRTG